MDDVRYVNVVVAGVVCGRCILKMWHPSVICSGSAGFASRNGQRRKHKGYKKYRTKRVREEDEEGGGL